MIPEHYLGRWECVNERNNKFYTILYDEETGTYTHIFGAIGCAIPNERRGNKESAAWKKIKAFDSKGYVHVGGQTKVVSDKVTLKKTAGKDAKLEKLGKRKLDL